MKINSIIMIFMVTFLLGIAFSDCSTKIKKNTIREKSISTGNSRDIDKDDNENKNYAVILKERFPGNSISDVDNPEKYVGEYNAYISNFKATITLFIINNKFYGEIKYEQWGNGLPQPLKDLKITDNKIFFIRSISTDQEIKKFNSNRFFKQQYHGIFSNDHKQVKGYFIEAGAEASWRAFKK
jgi:hypothetical protein